MDNFVHIPKASGSTMRTILSRQYGVEHILYFEPGLRSLREIAYTDFLTSQIRSIDIRLITGHYQFGIHELISQPCRSFSIVRDPISRVLSDYYYAYSYPNHRLRREILGGELSPEEFISHPRFGAAGAQAFMLAGRQGPAADVAAWARDNVRLGFVAVGVAERFDESALFIAKMLQWRPPLFVNRNVTKLPAKVTKTRKAAERAIRRRYHDLFATEFELHAMIDALLSDWVSAEGEPFRRALECYRGIQGEIESENKSGAYELYEFQGSGELPPFDAKFIGSEPYRTIEDYLNAEPRPRPLPRNYVGFVDVLNDRVVAGWAMDLWRDTPIRVSVYRSGSLIAEELCDKQREDVQKSRGGRANVGFRVALPEPSGQHMNYRVCFEDTSLCLQQPLY